MRNRFLFGQPVFPSRPSADGQRAYFILGAYPSACHVRWTSQEGDFRIAAVAVDNEPEPFWEGDDEHFYFDRWLKRINFNEHWGEVKPCGNLNGSSGIWIRNNVLAHYGITRSDAWITDCLDTYFESPKAANRLDEAPISKFIKLHGIPNRMHQSHPSEDAIVRMALADHRKRLLSELNTARSGRVITLGNAALRVFRQLCDSPEPGIRRLSVNSYGTALQAKVLDRRLEWIPLAHPGARPIYQEAHDSWKIIHPR